MGTNYKHHEKVTNYNTKLVERNTLIATCVLNIILSIAELTFYFLTSSTSILFDGIFSCFMTITSLVGLILTWIVQKKSYNYPFGKGVFDNIFSLFKHLLTITICIYFIVECSIMFYDINVKHQFESFSSDNYLFIIYTSIASVMSLIIILIYYMAYTKTNKTSTILKAEIKSSFVDLSISLAIGISLIVSVFVSNNQTVIANIDKSIALSLVVLITPSTVIAFVRELLNISGKRFFKDEEQELKEHLKLKCISDIFIIRHNQQKIFMINIDITKVNTDLNKMKAKISNHIYQHYSKDTEIYYFI